MALRLLVRQVALTERYRELPVGCSVASTLFDGLTGCCCPGVSAARGYAEERIKEPVRNAEQINARLLKIELTFNSGLLSDVYFYLSASCASPFFPMTRPLALGVD